MIFEAAIHITPREGVLDIQGKAVKKTLIRMNYSNLQEVTVGKIIKLKLEAENIESAKKSTESICKDLLVNELTETYSVSMENLS